MNLRLYGQSEQWYRYNVVETGFRPEISRQITKELQAAVFMQAKEVTTTDEGIDPAKIGPDSYFVSSLGSSLTLDTRSPDKLNPRQGLIGSVIGEIASTSLGSTVEFMRATARLILLYPSHLADHARPRRARRMDEAAERQSGRHSASMSGFSMAAAAACAASRSAGSGRSDWHGYPIGGDTFTNFNAEYQFPLYGSVIGAVFADAGSVGRLARFNGPDALRGGPRPAVCVAGGAVAAGCRVSIRTGAPASGEMVIHISFGMAF